MNLTRPPSNDFLKALRGLPCAKVPFQETEVSARHVDAVLGRPVGLESQKLAPADYVEFTLASGQSALYFNALWKAGRVYRTDSAGQSQYVGGSIKTRKDFAGIQPFGISEACERVDALIQAASRQGLAVMISFPSPFRLALYAMGYEDFFMQLHDDPELVKDLMAHFEEPALKYLEALLKYPVDAFFLAGSICANTGPLLSPPAIRQLWIPAMQRFLQPIRARDLPVVLHMDGDFSSLTDLLFEIPISAIHPFEVTGRLDIYEFKRKFGQRITIWGNLDLSGALTRGTPEQVREEVRRHIERLAPGGRYILSSSHEISPDVPVENFRELIRSAKAFGNWPQTNPPT